MGGLSLLTEGESGRSVLLVELAELIDDLFPGLSSDRVTGPLKLYIDDSRIGELPPLGGPKSLKQSSGAKKAGEPAVLARSCSFVNPSSSSSSGEASSSLACCPRNT